jgi:lysophospholipase L1-like esterase
MNERLRKGLLNLGLVVASVVVFFVIAEGYFAVFNPQIQPIEGVEDNFTSWGDFFQYDEMLGWADKPNIEGVHVQKEWSTQIRINSKGLRDQEYEYKKPDGIKRVVVLGDSFTWGYGVEEYERFTEVLEDTLLENWQVINLGNPAYGNDQELLIFENEGVKYNPDLVVVAFYMNDIMDNLAIGDHDMPRPLFVLNDDNKLILTNVPLPRKGEDNDDNVKENVTLFLSFRRFMSHHSHAYSFISDRIVSSPDLLNFFKKIGIADKRTTSRGKYGFNHYNWNLTKAILKEIDAVAKTNNAKTMIVIIPTREQVYKNRDLEINGALIDFGKESNIPVLDLLPEFREHAKNSEQLYFKIDRHWNANGHKLAAELIYDKLIEEQLIPLGGEH